MNRGSCCWGGVGALRAGTAGVLFGAGINSGVRMELSGMIWVTGSSRGMTIGAVKGSSIAVGTGVVSCAVGASTSTSGFGLCAVARLAISKNQLAIAMP